MPTESEFQPMRDAYARVAPDPAHFDEIAAKTSGMVHSLEGCTDDELRSLHAPTLLLVGDTDSVPLDHAARMLELIPDSELAVLPGTTHAGVTRRPNQVLALVGPFLDLRT